MSSGELKIRIFGSNTCKSCSHLTKAFDMHGFSYEFVDADDEVNDKLCEQHKVDELPHTQVLSDEGEVLYNHVGYVAPYMLLAIVADTREEQDNDLHLKGVGIPNGHIVKPKRQPGKGCSDCGRAKGRSE